MQSNTLERIKNSRVADYTARLLAAAILSGAADQVPADAQYEHAVPAATPVVESIDMAAHESLAESDQVAVTIAKQVMSPSEEDGYDAGIDVDEFKSEPDATATGRVVVTIHTVEDALNEEPEELDQQEPKRDEPPKDPEPAQDQAETEVTTEEPEQLTELQESMRSYERVDEALAELAPGIQHRRPDGWEGAEAPDDRDKTINGVFSPDVDPLTPEVEYTLDKNAAYFNQIGCSAYIIRDAAGNAIGATTAQHCGLYEQQLERFDDSDGSKYVTPDIENMTVSTGDSISNLEVEGTVSHIITAREGSLSGQDNAILVFDGSEPRDVFDAVQSMQAPMPVRGETYYFAGWPVDQDNNHTGEMRRQMFGMTYLGSYDSRTSAGTYLKNVHMFAAKSNAEGAECSPGSSGSGAIDKDGKLFGQVVVYIELTPDVSGITQAEGDFRRSHINFLFDVNTEGYDVICGVSTNTLSFEDMEVASIQSADYHIEVDDRRYERWWSLVRSAQESALEELEDPEVPKQYIQGIVATYLPEGFVPFELPKNPILHYDDEGGLLVYWKSDAQKGGPGLHFGDSFNFRYFLPEEAKTLYIYQDEVPEDVTGYSAGVIQSNSPNSLIDESGSIIGSTHKEPIGLEAQYWPVLVDTETRTVNIANLK